MESDLIRIKLSCGRHVLANAVHIKRTYASLYVGKPNDEMNKSILSDTIREMKRIFYDSSVLILEPEIKRGSYFIESSSAPIPTAYLPQFEFAIHFICFDPIASNNDASDLVIVWHQHPMNFEVSDSLRKRFEAVAWDKCARDFNW